LKQFPCYGLFNSSGSWRYWLLSAALRPGLKDWRQCDGRAWALGSSFFMTSPANPPRNKSATLQHHHKGDGHEYSKSNNHDADWIIRGHFEHGAAP